MSYMIRQKPRRVPLGEIKREYSIPNAVPSPNDFIFEYEFVEDKEDEEVLTYARYSYKDSKN